MLFVAIDQVLNSKKERLAQEKSWVFLFLNQASPKQQTGDGF